MGHLSHIANQSDSHTKETGIDSSRLASHKSPGRVQCRQCGGPPVTGCDLRTPERPSSSPVTPTRSSSVPDPELGFECSGDPGTWGGLHQVTEDGGKGTKQAQRHSLKPQYLLPCRVPYRDCKSDILHGGLGRKSPRTSGFMFSQG